jgi:cell division septum initiation protein DivIVA
LGRYEGEQSTELSVLRQPANDDRSAPVEGGREELEDRFVSQPPERPSEREELLAKVRKLEQELARYRAHAERTSRLFLSVANYADWVRENARHDAELALRKARAKAAKLEARAGALEQIERELELRQGELARLQALTDETRTRLSAFLTAGLDALRVEVEPAQDLPATLHGRVASTSWERDLTSGDP